MTFFRRSFFTTHKRTLLALIFGLAFSATLAYAVPPSGGYSPGTILDPDCAPGTTDCIVNLPAGGSSQWDDVTGGINYAGGRVGIGTTTPTTALDVVGTLTVSGDIAVGTVTLRTDANNNITFGIDNPLVGTDNFFVGNLAGANVTGVIFSNFIGASAGYGALNAEGSNFIGTQAGNAAINASNSNFIGQYSGADAADATNANFIGTQAGNAAANAYSSNFMGNVAGYAATNAYHANFIGTGAGYQASEAHDSVFIGSQAGYVATNATNAIFIGTNAGNNDIVDNTAGDLSSILIGAYTNTGGFSNSILLGSGTSGSGIANTKANQFMLADTITDVRWRGVEYALPGAQGAADSFLKNDGSGVLSWGTITPPGVTVVNTSSLFSTGLSGFGSGSNATNAIFFGADAGNAATGSHSSIFLGSQAGSLATNSYGSIFLGGGAGASAADSSSSVFIGTGAGAASANTFGSVFLGTSAGSNSSNLTNSIVIGRSAGLNETIDNNVSNDDYSILIGIAANTGGFKNSIALGYKATNTASNQLMIGNNAWRGIDTVVIRNPTNQCTITVGTGIACTSDERFKTNIVDLPSSTLDTILNIRTVTYNWLANPSSPQQIGFIAQDLETYFPQLVATDSEGYKSVYYAQMTPILVEAIREMNLKIIDINDLTKDNSWRSALTEWFASATNGITSFFAGEVTTKTLCVADDSGAKTCLTKGQLDALLGGSQQTVINNAPSIEPTPEPVPDPAPTETSADELAPAEEATETIVSDPTLEPTPVQEVVEQVVETPAP